MISLLKAPSVQRNVKKCLENASFEKLIVLPSSGTKICQSSVDMNMYVCAEKLIWKALHETLWVLAKSPAKQLRVS